MRTVASTQTEWRIRESTTGTPVAAFPNTEGSHQKVARSDVKLTAIHTYLRAVRALGKQQISSSDVAHALDLSEREVRRLMATMTDRGVKTR